MQLALRLAMACFVIAAPTLLYLGLLRGLERLRDDALLMRIAESDDAPRDVSAFAAKTVEERPVGETRPVRADGRGSTAERPPRPESVTCGTCGASNMLGARYCGECLDELR